MKPDEDMERRLAALERAGRLKDELLSVLSHELRAPLHAILGWSEILRARAEQSGSSDELRGLEAIGRNARLQAQLIDDVLDLNRLATGKLKLEPRMVDLGSALSVAIETVRPLAAAKELRLRLPESAPTSCDADPQRLQQILGHLLARAIKAAPAGGEIALTVRHADGQAELAITTAGAPQAKGTQPGIDVGLSLMRSLVELHGGMLLAHDGGSSHGASFVIRLPLPVGDDARPAAAAQRSEVRTGPSLSLRGVKVLVIDDDRDARELVKAILTEAHADAITAASADEGLAILRDARPDLIISDIGMALRDGYQFMRLVRTLAADAGGRTPALALTAYVQIEDRARALLAGYQEHVSKPVEAHQLIAAVHRLARASDGESADPARRG